MGICPLSPSQHLDLHLWFDLFQTGCQILYWSLGIQRSCPHGAHGLLETISRKQALTIKKARNRKCWWGCGEKETFLQCWWECKLVQPLWKTVWRFLKKLELLYDTEVSPWSIYLKKIKHQFKLIASSVFLPVLFTITKIWMQPKCPSVDHKWIKKTQYTYMQWNIT